MKATPGPLKKYQHLTRAEEVAITRLRIGHTKATKSHILSRGPPTACHRWGQTLSIDHMLLECAALQGCREEYYTIDSLNTLFETIPETCIAEFLRGVGFFYLIWCNLLNSTGPQAWTIWSNLSGLFKEWKQLWDTFTCVGRLICHEERVTSLNKSNPFNETPSTTVSRLMAESDSPLGSLRLALVYRYYFCMEETEEHTKIIISLEIYIQENCARLEMYISYMHTFIKLKRWIHLLNSLHWYIFHLDHLRVMLFLWEIQHETLFMLLNMTT